MFTIIININKIQEIRQTKIFEELIVVITNKRNSLTIKILNLKLFCKRFEQHFCNFNYN